MSEPDLAAIRAEAVRLGVLTDLHWRDFIGRLVDALDAQAERLARAEADSAAGWIRASDATALLDKAQADLAAAREQAEAELLAKTDFQIDRDDWRKQAITVAKQLMAAEKERDQACAEATEQRGRAERMETVLGSIVACWGHGYKDEFKLLSALGDLIAEDARTALAPPEPAS